MRMFDLEGAIQKARQICLKRFTGEPAVENIFSLLDDPAVLLRQKKRLLAHLGVITGEVFIGPAVVHLDIVGICNLNCIFCRDHSPRVTHREKWREKEMPFALISRLMDEAVEIGAVKMPFLGAGEPFLHTRFPEIIEKVKKTPLEFEVFTNGLLCEGPYADLFLDADKGRVHFSIGAATEETYNKFRPHKKGSLLPKIEQNISYLSQKRTSNLTLIIVHVINNMNFHEVIPMMERAIALGVEEVQYKLTEIGDFSGDLRLTPEQLHSLELELRHAKNLAGQAGVDLHDNIDFQLQEVNPQTGNYAEGLYDKMGCHIGWELVRIRRDGQISFCCALKFLDTINDNSLVDYWYGPRMKAARLAARGFPVGQNFEIGDGQMLKDPECDYCYNYIANFHSENELCALGLMPILEKARFLTG